jgi:hypothetical protein
MDPITEISVKVVSYFSLLEQILGAAGIRKHWLAIPERDRLICVKAVFEDDLSLQAKAREVVRELVTETDGPEELAAAYTGALAKLETQWQTRISERSGGLRPTFPFEKERQRLIEILFEDGERKPEDSLVARISAWLKFCPSFVAALSDEVVKIRTEAVNWDAMRSAARRRRGCLPEVEANEAKTLREVLDPFWYDFTAETAERWTAALQMRLLSDRSWMVRVAGAVNFALPFRMVLDCELNEIERSRGFRTANGATKVKPDGSRAKPPADPVARAHEMELLGLAFSGGGIRSATFNLGILQALSEMSMLRHVDYLSTVSGGGYIGSWLAAWTRRLQDIRQVENRLCRTAAPNPRVDEVRPIRYLREFSNYLTPVTGFFSADTWTLVATWFRNTLLNQIILICAIASLLLIPRVLHPLFELSGENGWKWAAFAALASLCVGGIGVGINLNSYESLPSQKTDVRGLRGWGMLKIHALVILPIIVAAVLGSWALWESRDFFTLLQRPHWTSDSAMPKAGVFWWLWASFSTVLMLIGLFGRYWKCFRSHEPRPTFPRAVAATFWILVFTVISAALGAVLGCLMVRIFRGFYGPAGPFHVMTFGVPILICCFGMTALLQIGLLGINYPDERREWWSRLGAWLLIYLLGWTGLYSIAVLGPLLIAKAGTWAAGAGLTWGIITAAGVKFANSVATGRSAGPKKAIDKLKDTIAGIAPYVFIAGMLLLISFGIHLAMIRIHWKEFDSGLRAQLISTSSGEFAIPNLEQLDRWHWELMHLESEGSPGGLDLFGRTFPAHHILVPLSLISLTLISLLLAWRIDVNEFSMHHFYKNRLVRCYLGASRRRDERRPNGFTGFDLNDDIKLVRFQTVDPVFHDLKSTLVRGQTSHWFNIFHSVLSRFKTVDTAIRMEEASRKEALAPLPPGYYGPLPILNTALNVTKGENLAWQDRKAESFVFTPLYCGFEYVSQRSIGSERTKDALKQYGFRPTRYYGYGNDNGIGIGTVVAISGAAANPNMGYHSSPAAAFLMTLFNVRLGWWLGNPRAECRWTRSSPRLGLFYLLKDLTGNTTNRSSYVSLSDGGHFENLGVYELIRRRCRYIIVCDAEQDGDFAFVGLGNLIRRCRTDFGVEIDINLDQIRRLSSEKYGKAHCVVGDIIYAEDSSIAEDGPIKPATGKLIYIKSSLSGDEPADVLEYASVQKEFPHQSTGDQWFDEPQFESYRKLGYHIGLRTFESASEHYNIGSERAAFFDHINALWFPPTREVTEFATTHMREYADLLEKLRGDRKLESLDPAMFPGLATMASVLPNRSRDTFLFCNQMIRFMERVYTELRLEEDRQHPYKRAWLEVFKAWAKSEPFEDAWHVCKPTYTERFRRFYDDTIRRF